jgi:hypothetical protein
MVTLATIVAVAALIGAAVSWVFGALSYVQTLRALSGENKRSQMWYAMVAWLFASRQMTGEAAVHAAKANKALVAFFTSLMIAIVAISLATNLARMPR